ncbi:MAG: DMT family transporter [Acidimicrobiales bacterium]|nr:DMT family transporter [Acidimicrobiales bacterium]
MNQNVRASLSVAAAALLFGSTFVVMKDSVADASPTAFLAARFGIGAAVVLGLAARRSPLPRGIAWPAVATGGVLLLGYVLQTVGLQYTSTSTSAFITYMLVVLVPVYAALLHRELPRMHVFVALVVTATGLWLLTGGVDSIGKGEWLTVGCAAAYAAHILCVNHWTNRFDLAWFTGLQLLVVSVGAAVPGALQGGYDFGWVAWRGAIFTGVGASAIAFLLQIYGQRLLGPTRTAIVLMIEPVSAAVIGYAIGERLGANGLVGALLILLGVGLAELGGLIPRPSTKSQ